MAISGCQIFSLRDGVGKGCRPACVERISQKIQGGIAYCSTTEFKVNALVVLGGLLTLASLAGGAGFIAGAVILNPLFLLGVIPMLALNVLGMCTLSCADEIHDAIPLPPGAREQPVGLSNPSSDCWANASIQLLMNIPHLKQDLLERRVRVGGREQNPHPYMERVITEYEAAQGRRERVITREVEGTRTSGNTIRRGIRQEQAAARVEAHARISERGQEDALDFFNHFFEGDHALYNLEGRIIQNGIAQPPAQRREGVLSLALPPGERNSLKGLMAGYFYDHLNGYRPEGAAVAGPAINQLRFNEAPEHLLFQLRRFEQVFDVRGRFVPRKNSHRIDVPQNFILSPSLTVNASGALYECNGFIVHQGPSLHGGHYVAYIKMAGSWWLCNDRVVRPVSEEVVLERMPHGYIYDFRKAVEVPGTNEDIRREHPNMALIGDAALPQPPAPPARRAVPQRVSSMR